MDQSGSKYQILENESYKSYSGETLYDTEITFNNLYPTSRTTTVPSVPRVPKFHSHHELLHSQNQNSAEFEPTQNNHHWMGMLQNPPQFSPTQNVVANEMPYSPTQNSKLKPEDFLTQIDTSQTGVSENKSENETLLETFEAIPDDQPTQLDNQTTNQTQPDTAVDFASLSQTFLQKPLNVDDFIFGQF